MVCRTYSAFNPARPVSEMSRSSHVAEPRNPSLSPKQSFQSQIRALRPTRQVRSGAGKATKGQEGRHQLQQVSSLRVQPHRSQADLPVPQSDRIISSSSASEPDFVIEEREAWRRTSPKPAEDNSQDDYFLSSSTEDLHAAITLEPPQENTVPLPQPRKRHAQKLPLRPFQPSQKAVELNERPKTRHGPGSGAQGSFSIHEDRDDTDSDSISITDTIRPARRSKFLEGSMNQRSIAVASSWEERSHKSVYEESTDTESDTTPRASHNSCQSSSFQGDEAKQLPNTPATTKRGFLRFRSNAASIEDASKESPLKRKKGLRKSISTWNFHNLGEKMRIFGGSTTDLGPDCDNASSVDGNVKVLNDRKRKAEVAYDQLGLKKQKSNIGLHSRNGDESAAPPISSVRSRRSISGASTITSKTASRQRRALSGPGIPAPSVDHLSENDLRKQTSRADLLKENQQLRQLLRESQSQHLTRSSSAHLSHNLGQHDKVEDIVTAPGRSIPPVSSFKGPLNGSERKILGNMGNTNSSTSRISPQSLRVRGESPIKFRAVSVIEEEPEEEPIDHEKVWRTMNASASGGPQQGQQWEWPDDVF